MTSLSVSARRQLDICTSGNLGSNSLSKVSGNIVIIKVMTIFEHEELDEIITELKGSCNKSSEYLAIVHDCFIFAGNLYLVMDYFENGSLMDLVGRFSLPDRQKINT